MDGKTIMTVQAPGEGLKIFDINTNKDLKAPLERVRFLIAPVLQHDT
jgi:hypothetical protein